MEETGVHENQKMEETGINENLNMENPEKAFVRAYRQFKQVIVCIRNELKKECSKDQLYIFIDTKFY